MTSRTGSRAQCVYGPRHVVPFAAIPLVRSITQAAPSQILIRSVGRIQRRAAVTSRVGKDIALAIGGLRLIMDTLCFGAQRKREGKNTNKQRRNTFNNEAPLVQ